MQFIDLFAQQSRIKDKIDANIQTVLSHGKYIMGPEVAELEQRLAGYVGCKHAVGCASGTDALLMALMAMNVGPGDAVFTSPFTFIATAEVIQLLGATPVFVDIDKETFNMDPNKLESAIKAVQSNNPSIHPLPKQPISAKRGAKIDSSVLGFDIRISDLNPRCIIPVDLFGVPADYGHIDAVAEQYGLLVIEDAAQSFGAEMNGKKACSFGHIAATSFFPAKPLGCYGDGGMCFTGDDALAGILQSIRVHGKGNHKYDNARIGINGRLDTIQAAILLAKFDIFPEEIKRRQQVADRYAELLLPLVSSGTVVAPKVPDEVQSAWAQYSILADSIETKARLQSALKEEGIPTAVYYPKPLHLQTAFKNLGYKIGDFPLSEDASKRIFSIPMHPYLTEADQRKIVEVIASV
jgi:UDP-2-acetamido-2-deoxy-ribo-hexuluronate aminotransferase